MSDRPESETASDEPLAAVGMATGLFRSLTDLAATLLALAHTRLELLTTELQEEVQRTASLIIWTFIALLAAILGLFFGGLTIILAYWETHRVLAAVLVTSVLFVFAVVSIGVLILKAKSRPKFLDATLSELKKDAQSLKSSFQE